MSRLAALVYGVVCHVMFLVVFLYFIVFLGNFGGALPGIPLKTIDSGEIGPIGTAMLVNLGLLSLFGVQHSVMARQRFKVWWTRAIPAPIERSTYVLISNLLAGRWGTGNCTSIFLHLAKSSK